ncbi:hypothetical protein N7453_004281 [Penicillium expansum]|nr:hypothetical protein N7453_004281 [Penicillium expansum]
MESSNDCPGDSSKKLCAILVECLLYQDEGDWFYSGSQSNSLGSGRRRCVVIEEICHDSYYIYRSLECLSVMLRYSGLFGLVCNSPVQPWAGCNKIVVFMRDPRGYI